MKIKYFQDTDTLYIEFREADVAESKDLDEDTVMDIDSAGHICAITVEHAKERADIPNFSFEQTAA
ncbi:MAG: DUF2283 domain-containing protein [Gammaproteobacteria bacterium]|nr:DUF2283 domain-containing protein [Gammaproteobacteria bacterium]